MERKTTMSRHENNKKKMKTAKRARQRARRMQAAVGNAAAGTANNRCGEKSATDDMFAITLRNDGENLVETDYWESPVNEKGLVLLVANAGIVRLLVPSGKEPIVAEMRTGKHAVITCGPHVSDGRQTCEIMFDDGSTSPFAILITAGFTVVGITSEHLTSKAVHTLIVYTEGCREHPC
jgi:hypothetical protein